MNVFLLLSFFINSLISAFIGLGGGTFYLLFLDLFSVHYAIIPFIALLCNISVSGFSAGIRLLRGQRERISFFVFLLLPSILSAYIGGQFVFSARNFRLILSSAVFFILCFSLLTKKTTTIHDRHKTNQYNTIYEHKHKIYLVSLISFGIGLLSGIIGIGGGIILGPILYMLGMSYRDIPLITAIYIFINSTVGIISQTVKYSKNFQFANDTNPLLYLLHMLIPYVSLILICMCSALVSLYINKKTNHENSIKNIVFFIMLVLALYNFIRSGVLYYV